MSITPGDMSAVLLDIVDFRTRYKNENEQREVLRMLPILVEQAGKYLLPHGNFRLTFPRQGTGDGYKIQLDTIPPLPVLGFVQLLRNHLDEYNRLQPDLTIQVRVVIGYGRVEIVEDQIYGTVLFEMERWSKSRNFQKYQATTQAATALFLTSLYKGRLDEALRDDPAGSELRELHELNWTRQVMRGADGQEYIGYVCGKTEQWPPEVEEGGATTVHNLPLSGVIAFRGRAEQLTELHEKLARAKPTAILAVVAGMGGVGKTELALQYAINHKQEYPGGIAWLEGENPETGLLNFASQKLEIQVPDYLNLDINGRLDLVLGKWPAHPALLILDDVSLPPPGFLERIPDQFRILITTREKPGKEYQTLALSTLLRKDALVLLGDIITAERVDSQTDDANQLCEWLGDLPLGIELVGAYLRKREDLSLAELLARLKEKSLRHKATKKDPKETMTAKRGVFAALDLSREKLEAEALELAMLLGQLAQAPVPLLLVEAISARYVDEGYDKEVWEEARAELVGFHLLERPEEKVYRLHPLVREYFRLLLEEQESGKSMRRAVAYVLAREGEGVGQDLTLQKAETIADLVPHWEWACETLSDDLVEDVLIWPFDVLARYYQLYNDLGRALYIRQACLEIYEKLCGAYHPHTVSSLNNLAVTYYLQGKYKQALPLYERALEVSKKIQGEEHSSTANSLCNLAVLYKAQGKYGQALPLYERALEIRKKVHGDEHRDTANSLDNLAVLYQVQGHYDRALPLCERALKLRKKIFGEEHPDIVTNLNNLGELHQAQGQYNQALTLHQHALEISKKVLGEEHPLTVTTLNSLGGFYYLQGQFEQALPLYKRALEISKKVLGDEHPDTAGSLNNLASLYYLQGKYNQALPLYERALEIRKNVLGDEHPDTAQSIGHLAELYRSLGQYEKVLPMLERALEIYEKVLGEEHPDTAKSLHITSNYYYSQGKFNLAFPYLERAVKIGEQVLGTEHPDTRLYKRNLDILKLAMEG